MHYDPFSDFINKTRALKYIDVDPKGIPKKMIIDLKASYLQVMETNNGF